MSFAGLDAAGTRCYLTSAVVGAPTTNVRALPRSEKCDGIALATAQGTFGGPPATAYLRTADGYDRLAAVAGIAAACLPSSYTGGAASTQRTSASRPSASRPTSRDSGSDRCRFARDPQGRDRTASDTLTGCRFVKHGLLGLARKRLGDGLRSSQGGLFLRRGETARGHRLGEVGLNGGQHGRKKV